MKITAFHGTASEFAGFNPLSHFGSRAAAKEVIEERAFIEDTAEEEKRILENGIIHEVVLDIQKPFPIRDIHGVHSAKDWAELICSSPTFIGHDEGIYSSTWQDIEDIRALKNVIFQPIDYQFHRDSGAFEKSMSDEEVRIELQTGKMFGVKNQSRADRENLSRQRMIQELMKMGFDGFVYANKAEDKGHISWVIFGPEQAVIIASAPYDASLNSTTLSPSTTTNDPPSMVEGTGNPHKQPLFRHLQRFCCQ